MSAITGVVTKSTSKMKFDDASSLWEFFVDNGDTAITMRSFDSARHPVVGDKVLVFLMSERNHATKVVFDADLSVTKRALA